MASATTPGSRVVQVDGVDVLIDGEGAETVVLRDRFAGIYRKFVLREGRLVGCVLVGDMQGALFYLGLIICLPIATLLTKAAGIGLDGYLHLVASPGCWRPFA